VLLNSALDVQQIAPGTFVLGGLT